MPVFSTTVDGHVLTVEAIYLLFNYDTRKEGSLIVRFSKV